jgi:homocysteine S-methyltransferase
MKNLFEPFIADKGIVISDGAMATELEARGANLNHALWSAKLLKEDPQLIQQVHYDYLMAGADIITTASYQASFEGFKKNGYSKEQAIELMQLSVILAINARNEAMKILSRKTQPLVAVSVGPYGASLADGSEYRGNYGVSVDGLKSFHRERLKVLIDAGADFLACETIPCIDEAIALVELLTEFPGVYAWISFSCKDETHISSGENFANAIKLVSQSPQMIAAGVNCTAPQYIVSLITIAAGQTNKPIVVYPNKGETWDAASKCWLPDTAHHNHFIDDAKKWFAAGATIIGGCCRTTPEDIRQLQELAAPTPSNS